MLLSQYLSAALQRLCYIGRTGVRNMYTQYQCSKISRQDIVGCWSSVQKKVIDPDAAKHAAAC